VQDDTSSWTSVTTGIGANALHITKRRGGPSDASLLLCWDPPGSIDRPLSSPLSRNSCSPLVAVRVTSLGWLNVALSPQGMDSPDVSWNHYTMSASGNGRGSFSSAEMLSSIASGSRTTPPWVSSPPLGSPRTAVDPPLQPLAVSEPSSTPGLDRQASLPP
jgi:hypothetical protein